MNIKSKYTSPLVLEKIEIIEGIFRKKNKNLDNISLGVQVNREIHELKENLFEVLLKVTISDEEELVFVDVTGRAVFSTEQKKNDMLEKNTLAIMFRYIRSYVSIITTQPGMNPIVLPAMNIIALVNDQKK